MRKEDERKTKRGWKSKRKRTENWKIIEWRKKKGKLKRIEWWKKKGKKKNWMVKEESKSEKIWKAKEERKKWLNGERRRKKNWRRKEGRRIESKGKLKNWLKNRITKLRVNICMKKGRQNIELSKKRESDVKICVEKANERRFEERIESIRKQMRKERRNAKKWRKIEKDNSLKEKKRYHKVTNKDEMMKVLR